MVISTFITMLRPWPLIILFILLFTAPGVGGIAAPVHLTRDSLSFRFDEGWKWKTADSMVYASAGYDDASWTPVRPGMFPPDSMGSIVWLRLGFSVDTSLTGRPLALMMTQHGASELYLDGRLLRSFGRLEPRDSVRYFDPQQVPFIFIIPDSGVHVLAVRFANYEAMNTYMAHGRVFNGFRLLLAESSAAISNNSVNFLSISASVSLMTGIFAAIGVLHLLLFLYYRSAVYNLSFSVFSLCLAALFLVFFIRRFSSDPSWQLTAGYAAFFATAGAALSLSVFINQVFKKRRRIWTWIIYALAAAAVGLRFLRGDIAFMALAGLIVAVSLEVVMVLISAIVRKVSGARILGAGLLMFTGLILLFTTLSIATWGEFDVDDRNTSGLYWVGALVLAILSIPVSISAYVAFSFSQVNKNLKAQLHQVQLLSEKTLQQEQEKKRMLEGRQEELEREVSLRTTEVIEQKREIELQHEELKAEKKKSDDLLLNILPSEIAEELKDKGLTEARMYQNVSVLFTDFVGFTRAGERMSPQELVNELHHCFRAFDEIIARYNIEKIKTIGDAYLAVSGLPNPDPEHAENVIRAALEIKQFMTRRRQKLGEQTFDIRIGVHSGSVVAGIVGVKKFAYDIWGDAVNTASRMEQHSEPGRINISQATYDLIRDKFVCNYRGEIVAKNKGALKMYFVEGATLFTPA